MSTRFSGVVLGVVTDTDDPEGAGRVKVRYPWLGSEEQSNWASMTAPMAGDDRGLFWSPEKDDEVVLAFHHGDVAHPFIIGFTWNGVHRPPSGDGRQRVIRSVNGHTIRFVDSTPTSGDAGALIIEDGNQNTIIMSNGKITIKAMGRLELEGAQVVLKGPGWQRIVVPNGNPI